MKFFFSTGRCSAAELLRILVSLSVGVCNFAMLVKCGLCSYCLADAASELCWQRCARIQPTWQAGWGLLLVAPLQG